MKRNLVDSGRGEKKQYDIKKHYTLLFRSLGSVNTINICIQEGCIRLITIDRKDVYNIKVLYFK